MAARYKFPVTRQSTCCCNPCSWLVDYTTGQPTSYSLGLSGLATITHGARGNAVGSQCCTGCCWQGCNPVCCTICGGWGEAWGDIDFNAEYVLEDCVWFNNSTSPPPPCLDTSTCLQTSSPPRFWRCSLNVPWTNLKSLQCCAIPACCSKGDVWTCAWLNAQLELTLPPCVPSSGATINAGWRLSIQPTFDSAWYCGSYPPYCPGPSGDAQPICFPGPPGVPAPTCCPEYRGVYGAPDGFVFTGTSSFVGSITSPGHVGGIAPLPSSWTAAPTNPAGVSGIYYPTCAGPTYSPMSMAASNISVN